MISLLISTLLMISPAFADSEAKHCERQARVLVRNALVDKAFGTSVDAAAIEKIMVGDFSNTTPGTYNQEYEMSFQVVFKRGSGHPMAMDGWASFYSGFICDNLKITDLKLE